jgi:outer membrane protein OmpA-like peptidoglycan-associated protein
LTISAKEIVISTLNVSAGSKFSLFAGSADPDLFYSTKTANIDNLTVAGILEIGVDLSSDNRNDLIVADNSITFLQGSYLNIVPFNEWSSPRTYSDIFTGELVGFENLNYNHSFFVLEYDKQMNTVSLKVISDPYYHQTPDFIKAVFVANTIRHLSRFDDSSIYENANENYWGVAQIGGSELKDSVDGTFATEITGVKAGAALIKKKNLKAGVYAGYDFGETSQKVDKYEFGTHSQKTDRAEFSAFQVGAYASLLTGNINLKALSAYQAITVKAKHEHDEFSTEFGINNINFGLSAELQTGKTLTPYISLVGSNISSDEISQSSESFNLNIAANSYFTLTSKAGVQVKTKVLRAKGFLGYVLIGNDPEFELTITNNNLKTFNSSSDLANPSSEEALFFGIEGGIDLPLTRQIALVINIQTNFMPTDYIAYQASVGVKYSWNDRERKGKKGNDNGELPPAKQNGGQATTTRQPADSKAGGQEEGTYVAIFDTNSSDLSQDALLVIINVVQNALRKQYTTIIVMGFAPDSANESANRTLSGLRAMAVARELQRYGIDRNKIKIEAYGSRRPRFPTGTLEGNVKNQRVEIDIVE